MLEAIAAGILCIGAIVAVVPGTFDLATVHEDDCVNKIGISSSHHTKDDKPSECVTPTYTFKASSCEWTMAGADTDKCGSELTDWCRASKGLSITSIVFLAVLTVVLIRFGKEDTDNTRLDRMRMFLYAGVTAFALYVSIKTWIVTETKLEECGLESETISAATGGASDFFLLLGLYAGVQFSVIIMKQMLPNEVEDKDRVAQTAQCITYMLLLGLSVFAIFTHLVDWDNNAYANAWRSHGMETIAPKFMDGGHCAVVGRTEWEGWCTSAKVNSVSLCILSGLAVFTALYGMSLPARSDSLIMAQKALTGLILLCALVHFAWSMWMVNNDVIDDGFDHMPFDGAAAKKRVASTGPAIWLTFAIAVSALLQTLWFDNETGRAMYARLNKLLL